jgi:hypothetical protein
MASRADIALIENTALVGKSAKYFPIFDEADVHGCFAQAGR